MCLVYLLVFPARLPWVRITKVVIENAGIGDFSFMNTRKRVYKCTRSATAGNTSQIKKRPTMSCEWKTETKGWIFSQNEIDRICKKIYIIKNYLIRGPKYRFITGIQPFCKNPSNIGTILFWKDIFFRWYVTPILPI